MKRNLLAIAIPALLVAGAANAAQIYNQNGTTVDVTGRAKAFLASDSTNTNYTDSSDTRFGLSGKSAVSNTVSAFGKIEYQTDIKKAAGLSTRYAFAGLDFGKLGAISYGKNDGVLNAITGYTDTLPEFGGDSSTAIALLGDRTAKVATYTNSGLFGAVKGLDVAVQYAAKTETGLNDGKINAALGARAYGANAQYAVLNTGLTVGVGYATAEKLSGDLKSLNTLVAGVNYNANNIYAAATYTTTEDTSGVKTNGYEAVVKYGINVAGKSLTPSVAYSHAQVKDATDPKVNYVDLGLAYGLNNNLTAVAEYQFNLIKNGNNQSTVGLVYTF